MSRLAVTMVVLTNIKRIRRPDPNKNWNYYFFREKARKAVLKDGEEPDNVSRFSSSLQNNVRGSINLIGT